MFVDFDGTLSPIVDDPADARPLDGTVAALERLAGSFARVAVISGRPVAYLLSHVAAGSGVELVGLYGLERARAGSSGPVVVSAAARPWGPVIETAASAASTSAPAGVSVERKGLAVTLHYRGADDLETWVASFAQGEASRLGLVAHPGKKSWELRPPVATDKGTVVSELAAGLDAVCYVGDDLGDLPAFEALGRLGGGGGGVVTLAVAVRGGDETPAALLGAADLVVDGPAGVLELLELLTEPVG